MLQYRTETLDNGLRVAVVPQPALHRAHVALYVRVGSRFERPETNGLSHFLEHMIYRGTERLKSAHEVNLAFEELGGYLYAATHTDFGVYSVTLPPESLARATALFGEVLTAPAFLDIELEKEIVCEEILEDLDDEGRQVDADNISRALIYPGHGLGYTITGDEKTVRSFDAPGLRAHHARHYTAEQSVLIFSGAVEMGTAMDLAEKHFSKLRRGARVGAEPPPPLPKKPRLRIVENASSQTELRVCFRTIAESDPKKAAMDVLMRIIDDGMSTRLYHRICDAQGLCYDVSGGYDGYEDDGVVDFAAGVQHARTTRVTREILAVIEELTAQGPTDDELEKARHRFAWDQKSTLDSAEDLAAHFGVSMVFDRFVTPEERRARFDAVTRDDVRRMAAHLADPTRLHVAAVGLLENDEDKRLAEVVKGWTPRV